MSSRNRNKSILDTNPDSPARKGFFPLHILEERYGYAKDYIGWLARTGRVEAVRYGKYGQWYVSDVSLKNYRKALAEAQPAAAKLVAAKSVSQSTQASEKVLSFVPSFVLLNKSSYSAKLSSPVSIPPELKRINAVPRMFMLVLGGILFLSVYFRPFINDLAPQMARAAMGERNYAGIVDAFRNIVRLFTDDYSTQTYILIDPFRLREEKIKEQERRIAALEKQIVNNQFSISNQIPITNDPTCK